MFIYSIRASTIRFFAVIVLTIGLLVGALGFGGSAMISASAQQAAGETNYRFDRIRTPEDRIGFLAQFGVEVTDAPAEEESFTMPQNFDRVLVGYNEIQKSQGLNIAKYARKKVTRYTYEVRNAPGGIPMYVTLLTHRDRVIGCDVASGDPAGFVRPLTDFPKMLAEGVD